MPPSATSAKKKSLNSENYAQSTYLQLEDRRAAQLAVQRKKQAARHCTAFSATARKNLQILRGP